MPHSELLVYFFQAQMAVLGYALVATAIVWAVRRAPYRERVAAVMGVCFLAMHVLVIAQGTTISWSEPHNLVTLFTVSQFPAVAIGFELYSIRRTSGKWRLFALVVTALAGLDLFFILYNVLRWYTSKICS